MHSCKNGYITAMPLQPGVKRFHSCPDTFYMPNIINECGKDFAHWSENKKVWSLSTWPWDWQLFLSVNAMPQKFLPRATTWQRELVNPYCLRKYEEQLCLDCRLKINSICVWQVCESVDIYCNLHRSWKVFSLFSWISDTKYY